MKIFRSNRLKNKSAAPPSGVGAVEGMVILSPEFTHRTALLIALPRIQVTNVRRFVRSIETDNDIGHMMARRGEQFGQSSRYHWTYFVHAIHGWHIGSIVDDRVLSEQGNHSFGFGPVEMIALRMDQIRYFRLVQQALEASCVIHSNSSSLMQGRCPASFRS